MKKSIVISIITVCIILLSVLAFISREEVPVVAKNLSEKNQQKLVEIPAPTENKSENIQQELVEKSSTVNITPNDYLDLKKRIFDPNLIGFYTGKPMEIKLDDVLDGVYVTGVKAHSGKQVFNIYSKDKTLETQNLKVKIEDSVLKIFVEIDGNGAYKEEHMLFSTNTSEIPEKYEVFRNNTLEKSEEIFYGIE